MFSDLDNTSRSMRMGEKAALQNLKKIRESANRLFAFASIVTACSILLGGSRLFFLHRTVRAIRARGGTKMRLSDMIVNVFQGMRNSMNCAVGSAVSHDRRPVLPRLRTHAEAPGRALAAIANGSQPSYSRQAWLVSWSWDTGGTTRN